MSPTWGIIESGTRGEPCPRSGFRNAERPSKKCPFVCERSPGKVTTESTNMQSVLRFHDKLRRAQTRAPRAWASSCVRFRPTTYKRYTQSSGHLSASPIMRSVGTKPSGLDKSEAVPVSSERRYPRVVSGVNERGHAPATGQSVNELEIAGARKAREHPASTGCSLAFRYTYGDMSLTSRPPRAQVAAARHPR